MDRKMVNFIKEQYPPGTRIRLNSMEDPYHPILPGTEGEVDFVDNEGQIFMKWDNGKNQLLIFCVLGIMEIRKGGGANDRICEK